MNHRQAVLGGDEDESFDADVGGETFDGKIAAVDLDDGRGFRSDRPAIVVVVGAIGRADLD